MRNETEEIHTPSSLSPLPERVRLIHIGTMKTGTTAIQRAARRDSAALMRSGVRYPGAAGYHQADEVCAFMGLERQGKVPPIEEWDQLMAEIEGDASRRIFISYEHICEADNEMAQRFIDVLGERTHIAITLRPLSGLLSSHWQQDVKTGMETRLFDEWLQDALAHAPGRRRNTEWDRQSDQAGIVERWKNLLGADRVTVIIADTGDPRLVSSSFENLLDVPANTLDAAGADRSWANRSLAAPEVELFRRLNIVFQEHDMLSTEYAIALKKGAANRLRRLNTEPSSSGHKILLPSWAAERAAEYGKQIADRLRDNKVRIVGDLDSLHAPVSSTVRGGQPTFDTISMQVAVEAIAWTAFRMSDGTPHMGVSKKSAPASMQARLKDQIRRLPLGNYAVRLLRRWRQWRTKG